MNKLNIIGIVFGLTCMIVGCNPKNSIDQSRLIDLVSFNTYDWKEFDKGKNYKLWSPLTSRITISARVFPIRPEPGLDLNDIESIRNYTRSNIENRNGGIIKVEKVKINDLDVVETIIKAPKEGQGMAYVGTYMVLLEKYQIVIRVNSEEEGVTGTRDAIVLERLIQSGKVKMVDSRFKGWFKDPYDGNYNKGTLMNQSELNIYDEDFPEHPLSRIRQVMVDIKQSLKVDPKLYK